MGDHGPTSLRQCVGRSTSSRDLLRKREWLLSGGEGMRIRCGVLMGGGLLLWFCLGLLLLLGFLGRMLSDEVQWD
jgi:hypothetical protein